jgi:precorrin-3B C17-methyltransferase
MEMSPSPSPSEAGKLFIVGTGPGRPDQMTLRAREAIAISDYVVGNDLYLDLIQDLLPGKEVIISSMGKEVDRAKKAVELAKSHKVAIVSGGDAGVYGMASIVLEIIEHAQAEIAVEIVPGVTAATAASALLGSPLSSDFMVISLSDLLTPWGQIERRLEAGFSTGIPIVLYNPKSNRRPGNLANALAIALKHLPATVPVGVVKDAYREGQKTITTTLGALAEDNSFVDMHSTVVIGGSESRIWKEGENVKGIITPRGYDRKYVY